MINFIKNLRIGKYPFLLFSPFLLFFILLILKFQSDALEGDESRYLYFADNLLHGFLSPPAPDINLWNGPGYALFLAPFVALKVPAIFMVLMNAVFYYLSVVLLFKAVQQVASFRVALLVALFWGCYYNSYQEMLQICTEPFSSFLTTLFLFFLLRAFDVNSKAKQKYMVGAGLTFAYLILTKVLFAYVLVILMAGVLLLYIFNLKKQQYKRGLIILLIAFAGISPYLMYTYSLTGRMFYLGNSGGMSLYWMTTPYENEYGDWFDDYYFLNLPADENAKASKLGNSLAIYEKQLKENHQADFDEILKYKYKSIDQDDAYKRLALRNIKAHPVKYLQNCISNIGRILFSNPYSYTLQSNKIFVRLPIAGIVFVLMLFCLIPTIKYWRRLIFPLQLILLFVFIYLGLSTLLSGYTRMFTIIVPLILYWIVFMFRHYVTINFRPKNEIDK
jgi:4-amino-4-deoxy-L-arabinose transferase-like glycosyltransferase